MLVFQEEHQHKSQSYDIVTAWLVSRNNGPGTTLLMMISNATARCRPMHTHREIQDWTGSLCQVKGATLWLDKLCYGGGL